MRENRIHLLRSGLDPNAMGTQHHTKPSMVNANVECTNGQTHKCTTTQMHKYTNGQILNHKCTNAAQMLCKCWMHKCSNIECTNAQMPKASNVGCTNAQISNAQMHTCANRQMSKYLDARDALSHRLGESVFGQRPHFG